MFLNSLRSIVLLASRGQPDGFAGVAQYLVSLGAAKVADLQGKGSSWMIYSTSLNICLKLVLLDF